MINEQLVRYGYGILETTGYHGTKKISHNIFNVGRNKIQSIHVSIYYILQYYD